MPSACRLGPVPRSLGQGAPAGHGAWQETHPHLPNRTKGAAPNSHLCGCVFHSCGFKQPPGWVHSPIHNAARQGLEGAWHNEATPWGSSSQGPSPCRKSTSMNTCLWGKKNFFLSSREARICGVLVILGCLVVHRPLEVPT